MDAEFYNFILFNKSSSQASDLFPTWELYVCRYTHDVSSNFKAMRKTNETKEALQHTYKQSLGILIFVDITIWLFPATVTWWWGETIFNPVAVPTEKKHQPEVGEKLQAMMFFSSCRSGDHWMNAKEDPRKLPWKILPTTKPGDLKPIGGIERFESCTLLSRLIAHSSQDLTSFSIRV